MKRILLSAGLACLATGVMAQLPTVTVSDNFNDGVRDRTLWRPELYGGKLIETGGHLFLQSGLPDPMTFSQAFWRLKEDFPMMTTDILQMEAQLCMPSYDLGSTNEVQATIGFGWERVGASFTNLFGVYFYQTPRGRSFVWDYTGPGGSGGLLENPPSPARKFFLRARFNAWTGQCRVWVRQSTLVPWTLLWDQSLSTMWGTLPGTPLTLRPFLYGGTIDTSASLAQRVFIDNVKIRWIRPY